MLMLLENKKQYLSRLHAINYLVMHQEKKSKKKENIRLYSYAHLRD